MKQIKQIMSIVLCLLMLVAVVPVMNMGMTASAYTEPANVSTNTVTAKANELLTKLGGDGAYFTVDRSYCNNPRESSHGCSNCLNSNIVATDWFKSLFGSVSVSQFPYQYYPNNGTGYPAGKSCHGFANFAIWYIFSQKTTDEVKTKKIGEYALTQTNFENYVWPGDVIRTSAGHSMLVLSWNSSGYTVIDSNYSGPNCQVHIGLRNYSSSTTFAISRATNAVDEPIPEVFVSTNKKHYSPNETATWSFDAEDANSVHLYIYKDGNKYFEGQFATNASYSRQLTTNGHYAFYIVAHYSSGDVSSAWNDCNVSELNAYESSGRTLFYTGETVNLKFSATFASSVHLYIYKDGKKFFEGQFKTSDTYSRIISDTGHYSYYIVAHYDTGNEEGVWKDFDVVLPSVQTDKQAYQIGDTAEFSFNSIGANSLHLYIYKDGKKFFEGQFLPSAVYKRALDSTINYAGDYYCYIISHYDSGNYQSENHFFSVESDHTHSYTASITKPATCSATGIKTFTCSCGDSYTETIPVNASNHVNTTNTVATASTCTVKGYTAGVYCNDCKKYISGHAEQPLAAHKTTTQNAKAATCTAEGYTGDQVCSVCKQTITKGTAIAKKAHTLTTVNQKVAGCTTAGYTGDQVCTTCNQTITKGSAVAALGHANADSNGNCTRCGKHIKDVTPTQPQTNPNACKYCGKIHTGAFGWLIKFFHSILAIFKR